MKLISSPDFAFDLLAFFAELSGSSITPTSPGTIPSSPSPANPSTPRPLSLTELMRFSEKSISFSLQPNAVQNVLCVFVARPKDFPSSNSSKLPRLALLCCILLDLSAFAFQGDRQGGDACLRAKNIESFKLVYYSVSVLLAPESTGPTAARPEQSLPSEAYSGHGISLMLFLLFCHHLLFLPCFS